MHTNDKQAIIPSAPHPNFTHLLLTTLQWSHPIPLHIFVKQEKKVRELAIITSTVSTLSCSPHDRECIKLGSWQSSLVLSQHCPVLHTTESISSYANDPGNAGNSLTHCIETTAKKNITSYLWDKSPIYLGATAGMRLLRWAFFPGKGTVQEAGLEWGWCGGEVWGFSPSPHFWVI